MNIIMTGSTSFVGAATVRELLRRGHTVTAIVRPKSSKLDTILEGNEEALLSGRLLVTENDLSEPEKLLEKVTKPQEVFCHFGWGGSGSVSRTDKALQEKNMEISLETIRTAKALGCKKFLFSGSQAEYGMHQDLILPCGKREKSSVMNWDCGTFTPGSSAPTAPGTTRGR